MKRAKEALVLILAGGRPVAGLIFLSKNVPKPARAFCRYLPNNRF